MAKCLHWTTIKNSSRSLLGGWRMENDGLDPGFSSIYPFSMLVTVVTCPWASGNIQIPPPPGFYSLLFFLHISDLVNPPPPPSKHRVLNGWSHRQGVAVKASFCKKKLGSREIRYVLNKAVNRGDKRTVFETEISWTLKGLVAIAIATAVRKKSLAAAEPAIRFSETPPRRERALDRCSRIETPPPALMEEAIKNRLFCHLHN